MQSIKIGRETDNHIILPDERIGRYHATLEIHQDGTMTLRDHSRNGTMVNGVKLNNASLPVKRGDTIMFAGISRLDWAKVPEKRPGGSFRFPKPDTTRSSSNRAWMWILLPILTLAGFGTWWWANKSSAGDIPAILSPKDVYNKYEKSVGMIFHAYYFKRKFGSTTVFIGIDKARYEAGQGAKLAYAATPDQLLPFIATGTGFLVNGRNGNIITNRHVANPGWIANENPEQLGGQLSTFIQDLQKFLYQIQQVYNMPPSDDEFQTHTKLLRYFPNNGDFQLQEDATTGEILDQARTSGIGIVGINYHTDKNIDLALMKTGGAQDTDRFHAIDLEREVEYNPDSTSVGDKITLLGFSGGLTLGYDDVRKRIVLKGPQGNVTSQPSIYHIEYDINVEHGSSGAPVFNAAGKVIAVNYMLRGGSRFGILSKYIRDLLENRNTHLISSE